MRIGLDMDDTICSTEETIIKFANKYSIEQKINPDDIWYDENIKRDFLTKYLETIYLSEPLKEDADKVINEIKNKGNEVIIITARSNSFININMEDLINNYLLNNGIIVDKIIINARNKAEICKQNNIDLMLDDSIYNYYSLTENGINTVLYDEEDKNKDIKNRVKSWKQFMEYINSINK